MLAILALISFQLLYRHVANSALDVASAQRWAVSQHVISAVFSVRHMGDSTLPTMKTPNPYGLSFVIYRQATAFRLQPGDYVNALCNKHAQKAVVMKNKYFCAFSSYEA